MNEKISIEMTIVIYVQYIFYKIQGKERASAESNAAVDNVARQQTPTSTKTVYGFLDFTTIVSDTMMIFKPSKIGGIICINLLFKFST